MITCYFIVREVNGKVKDIQPIVGQTKESCVLKCREMYGRDMDCYEAKGKRVLTGKLLQLKRNKDGSYESDNLIDILDAVKA